jgi:hypothetical protein
VQIFTVEMKKVRVGCGMGHLLCCCALCPDGQFGENYKQLGWLLAWMDKSFVGKKL